MRKRAFTVNALVLLHIAGGARAETLPLPGKLVDLKSAQGQQLFLESDARAAYFPLSINFVTQENQSYCGVASIVMALNALQVLAPTSKEFEPYRTFTQRNVLNEQTDAVVPRDTIEKRGMTLDQIGALLSLFSVKAEVHHAADTSLQQFRVIARQYLGKPDHVVIVNYLRRTIGQERGGHISPLGAYDPNTDRFLILDVARYKYPPVWVTAAELFDAMNTPYADNENKTRGFVLVSRSPVVPRN